jgi:hypothetical protein
MVRDIENLASGCAPCEGTGTIWPNNQAHVCKDCEQLHKILRDHKHLDCMDIYTPPGTKVVYHNPFNGFDGDIRFARKHLTLGAEYTVNRTDVFSSSTSVYLDEFPSVSFNHAHFATSPVKP